MSTICKKGYCVDTLKKMLTPLYARCENVALMRSATERTRGGGAYFGKDILGSVRSATDEYGGLEDRYEYDAFGIPYSGDFSTGLGAGYTGKAYDPVTGLYNYGYRDYSPSVARFTTVDPIRDGANWFSYVNNDPVNWVDEWGLSASDGKAKLVGHLLRNTDSYDTFNGKNKNKRGHDLLIIENKTTNESVLFPVSSVANMAGSGLKDTLSENNFTLTYDPNTISKYAPEVLTITSGTLFPEIPKATGESLYDDGTTKSNKIPWRAHETNYWGSEGCITGQTGNKQGSFTTLFKKFVEWGIKEKTDIQVRFGLGLY